MQRLSRGGMGLTFKVSNRFENSMKLGLLAEFMDQGLSAREASMRVLKAMPDLTNLTLFETNYAKRIFPWFCVPDDCEILTRSGWKTLDDLEDGEDVLTYNVDLDMAEWEPVQGKSVYDYNGTLMHIKSKLYDFPFTPNHRWPVWFNTMRHREAVRDQRKVVEGYRLSAEHRIPRSAPCRFNGADDSITEREAAILAWIFTDGHKRVRVIKGREYPEAVIYQKKQPQLDNIRALLGEDKRGEHVERLTGTTHVRMSAALARRMHALCPTKDDFPEFITRLTEPAARAAWEAMLAAEGSVHERAGTHFAQNRGPILDGFQILTTLLNRTADIRGRGAYVSKARRFKRVAQTLGTQWYKGRVWCPQTGNGTWFMRRNGSVIITGNSWLRRNSSRIFKYTLRERPGLLVAPERLGRAAQSVLVGDDAVPEELRPDWMREMQAAQIMGDEKAGSVFLLASWFPFESLMRTLGAVHGPGDFAQFLLEQTRPEIRTIVQAGTGFDAFKQQPLEKITLPEMLGRIPQAIVGASGTPLDNMLAVRPIREARRLTEMPDTKSRLTRALIGGAVQPVSAKRGLSARYVELRDEAQKVRSQINRALQVNDQSQAEALQRRLFQIWVQMRQFGLPGVPKSTQAILEQAGVTAGPPAFEQ